MKRFCKILMLIGLVFAGSIRMNASAQAADLDRIQEYVVEVNPYSDGSMEITYHVSWKVLDSTSEGPLTWVKLGIPNRYVEEITPISASIDDIRYYEDDGDYVRVDLDREYEAGEVVDIDFSIHQHQLYQEKSSQYVFDFTPGWFTDAKVDYMELRWHAQDGMTSTMDLIGNDYVETAAHMAHSQKMKVRVSYDRSLVQFADDYATRVDAEQRSINGKVFMLVFAGIPVLLVVGLLAFRRNVVPKDYYSTHKGMGVYYHSYMAGIHSHGGRSGGGCACACACACAGGGRAGCAAKEFYSAKHWKLRKTMGAGPADIKET